MSPESSRSSSWWSGLRSNDVLLASTIAVFAFIVRIIPELRGELPGGTDYDEGVYFASANALARGIVPYRDFVSVHPPGVPLLLAPIAGPFTALFGPTAGFIAARIAAALAGAVTTYLIYRCALRLTDRRAAVVASVLYATFAAAILAEGRVLLDPFMIVFGVAGSYLFLEHRRRRSMVLAGILLGLAVSMKLTGAVFLVGVLIVGLLVDRTRRRDSAIISASAAGTVLLITLPFMVLAGPGTFLSQVVFAQVDRPSGAGLPGNISDLPGRFSEFVEWGPLGNRTTLPGIVLVVMALVTVAVVAWAVMQRTPRAWFWTIVLLVAGLGLLRAPTFYVQYAALTGVPFAILLGGSISWLASSMPARIPTVAVAILLIFLIGWEVKRSLLTQQIALTRTQELLYSDGARMGCVFTDEPDAAFVSGIIPQDGLDRPLIDPFGELLSLGRRGATTALDALHSPTSQQRLRAALDACPWVILGAPIDQQFLWDAETKNHFLATRAEIIGGTPSAWYRRPGVGG